MLNKFETYTKPRTNIPVERYRFNCRQQDPNESFDQYVTAFRQLACKCDFSAVTPDELQRDRILFGITDCTVQWRRKLVELRRAGNRILFQGEQKTLCFKMYAR